MNWQIFILLFILVSSGCIQNTPPDSDAKTRTFNFPATATYIDESSGRETTVLIEQTKPVMNLHATSQEAFIVTFDYGYAGGSSIYNYALDDEFRIIRLHEPCVDRRTASQEDCMYGYLSYMTQGTIAPWAIGYPKFHEGLPFNNQYPDLPTDIASVSDNQSITYTIDVPKRYGGGIQFFPEGVIQFDEDRLFPLRFEPTPAEGAFEGDEFGPFQRTSVSYGEQEVPQPNAPEASVPWALAPIVDEFIPEADEQLFNRPFTPAESLEFLLDNNAVAASQAESGCVTGYQMGAEHTNNRSLAQIFDSDYTDLTILITDDDAQTTAWGLQYKHNATMSDGFTITGAQSRDDLDFQCIADSGPLLQPTVAEAVQASVPIHSQPYGNDEFVSFWYQREIFPEFEVRPDSPEYVASFLYAPEHIDCVGQDGVCTFKPYEVRFNANTGALKELRIHPQDIEAWDS